MPSLPVGKLPPDLLAHLLRQAPTADPRVLLKPGLGLDCAVVDMGATLLVYKSDPITFATDEMGWYLVQVNANDLATTGATPRWLLLTMLLPERTTTPELVETLTQQVFAACRTLNIAVIGGHTEVTYGLERPILVGTMIGEVSREKLVTPQGAQPGDHILLTKGVPIEATALLAREFASSLQAHLNPEALTQAQAFLHDPGISVVRDATIALSTGPVTAMHDPTEGGLAMALWELAEASGLALHVDLTQVPILPLAAQICAALGIDPLAAIASGALLLTAPATHSQAICAALMQAGIPCAQIGIVQPNPLGVWCITTNGLMALARPLRDEVARLYQQ